MLFIIFFVIAPSESIQDGIRITNSLPTSWKGSEGKLHLYKNDHLFLIKHTMPGDEVTFPNSPVLYFGLTSQSLNIGDVFTNRKLFTPLAPLDRSFYVTGANIQISDNPAGRPHVTINKV